MSTTPRPPTDLCKTGIEGFDDILKGGLPRNRLYLLGGEPGVGKTTMALQFLFEGARVGETSLYITLSETKSELNEVAISHGWDLSQLEVFELSAMEEQLKADADSTFFSPSEVQLNRTTKILLDEVERVRPTRVVFDSLSELRLMSETPLRYRRQILHLKQFFAGRQCTVLMLDDSSGRGYVEDQVESLAHGVIALTKSLPEYGVSHRQIRVQKIRGVKFREGNHDILMETGGLAVFPRLVASEHHRTFQREAISAGIPGVDSLMGGGIDRGTSSIFMGPAGTGKSTLAMCFVIAAANRGEHVLFYSFDETLATLKLRAETLGMGLSQHIANGRIKIHQIDPAEISPGELTHRIKAAVHEDGVRMVVIDSINGFLQAMPDQRHLMLHLHELLAFLNQQGITTLMMLTQQGLIGTMQTPIDLTYLADNVLLLRYFENKGAIRQAISVIKKRTGDHERTIREFHIRKNGVEVGEPLKDFQGILSGVPILHGDTARNGPTP